LAVLYIPRVNRLAERLPPMLVSAMAALVVLDIVGGLIAIATGVNTASEAWDSEARLAAPWPMILFQVAMTAVAVRARRPIAAGAAMLLAAACFISAISGFFDGGYAARELTRGHVAFQLLLISWTAFVGVLAAMRAYVLLRRPASADPSPGVQSAG
jgi:hypothetical protein